MASISLNRWRSNTLLFGLLIVGWTVAGAGVTLAFWSDLARQASPLTWTALLLSGGFFFAVLAYLVGYACGRLAGVSQFGDDLRFSTLLVERRLAWSEVGRIVFKEMSAPIPAKFTVKFLATDGTRFDVYATAAQAEALLALVETKTLSAQWPGQPLFASTVWAILGLGLLALVIGVGIDLALWQGWQLPVAGPMVGRAVIVAIGVPVLGAASVGFAVFHLVRRPIVIRPGVFRIKEAEAMSAKALFGRLFGRFD